MIPRLVALAAVAWVLFTACEHNPAGLPAPGPLATITILPDPDTLAVGTTRQFTAVGKDASGTVVAITPIWSVVATGGTINAGSGFFTAGTVPGTYDNTVTATDGGISGSATVTVVAGPLATITVRPDPADLVINATQQFTAVGTDAYGNVVAMSPTWSVVEGGGAIHGSSGLFTAGTVTGTFAATVKAASGAVAGFATVNVAAGPLAMITVSPDPDTLGMGATRRFTAVGTDAGGNVVAITPTWSVVASGGTIDAGSGLFRAGTSPGTYANTVRAASGDISGLATVVVTAGALASITVTPDPANLGVGAIQQFTAVGKDAFGNVVSVTPTWSVVASGGTIDAGSGLFTAGTVTGTFTNTVKATSGGIAGFATVTVGAGALASITVIPNPADLGVSAEQQFTAVGRDAFGNVVPLTPLWSVVAGGGTIGDGSGLFTAGTVPGTYANTVMATSGGVSGFATVTVVAGALASITVTPDPAHLGVGAPQQFTATGRDGFGNVVEFAATWSIVAGGGAIDAGSGHSTAGTIPGTYANTVRASSGGISGFATVTVSAGALASITITPTPVSLATTTSQQFTAVGRDAFGNVVAITPTWSTAAGGGTTSPTGRFTAGTVPGTYAGTVVATSGGISGSATVTVVAGPLATITVTPDPANLVIGATQQFTAVGRDASGNVVPITPTWSVAAGGGVIDAGSGLFKAGTVPGSFTNTVVVTSGGITEFATVNVVAGALASITVSPDPADLGIGATQTFTAVGRDASGNVVAVTPTWSVVAGGGTIDAGSGLFTAGTVPGTFTNTVQASSGGVSGSATVTVSVGALASITITPDPANLVIGAAQTFTAVGRDAFGNVVAISPTWSAIAGGGAIDGSSGLFTAGTTPGTYTHTVRATSGTISGFATVTVMAGPLATITVTPNPANIGIGATQQFTAVGRDAGGNVVPVSATWSVVAAGGAINTSSGVFTAGTVPGTFTNTVRATSGGISGFATVNVVAGALATITVTPSPANLGVGTAQQFTAVGRDASGNVLAIAPTWSVVASGGTIDGSSGLFTAGSVPGTFINTVQATSGGVSGFATVVVSAGALASITVTPNPANLGANATQQFTATGKDAFGNIVAVAPTWSVVAGGGTTSGTGLFTAGTVPGTYVNTMVATSGDISGSATVTVSAGALASVTVTPDPANLVIGGAQQFTATGKDAFGNVVAITPAWSAVAGGGTVNGASGLFTAGTVPGTFTNTVKATSSGISGFATVNVVAGPLATITVSPDPASLGIGATRTFTAVGRDASGNVVAVTPAWSVVAGGGTIDSGSGLFTAGTLPGTYANTVMATSGGISGAATVNVVAGPLATITVSPDPASLVIGATASFTAVGRDASGNVVAITPTWSVVAGGGTVNGSGVFTAGTMPGTYANTVVASSGGVSGSATVDIIAGALATITVSPDPAGLGAGAAQTFTAVGRDASGNVVAITPAWLVVAGGGTINSGSGLFTAGTVPGTYTNTVVATSGGVSGVATVTVSAGALASITVTPNPASLAATTSRQFTATGKDAFGNVVAITPTWSVVAGGGTTNGSGLFTAGTVPGTYGNTVKATAGGISGFATVNVVAGPLATITVSPDPADLGIGAAQQFTAVGRDASGNVVAVTPTWSVVAGGGTIDSGSGMFTAGTVPGTYTNTVQATSGGTSGFATVTVRAGPLATITVTPDPAHLGIGVTQTFTAVGKDASGNVVAITPTWSVVAGGGTIDSGSGQFTAGTVPGIYTNTVKATSGAISDFATVTVSAGALASIAITPDPADLVIGASQTFTAVGRDAFGNVVAITAAWSVVAGGGTIDGSSGVFTAGTLPGTYTNTVRATSGGISGFATVNVGAGALATITVSPDTADLGIGATQQFTAVGRDASGNVVAVTPTWSVVAGGGTTTGSGLFTAGTLPGTYANTVQATSGGVSGFATVNVVSGPLATITVTPDPASLGVGTTLQFTAVGRDASGNVVAIAPTWSVVAGGGTIDGAGLLTAGTVPGTYLNTVKVTSGGVSGFATVNVVAGPLATITVSPDPADLGIGAAQQFSAIGRDAFGNVVGVTPTWSVVASGGTIGESGLFTAGTLPGTYVNTVQATSGGVSGFATVNIVAGPLATITVSPNPASLGIGSTRQFTAVGRDASGNVVPITPTWSVVAAGGTISGSGLFTAGTVPGTYTNTVEATSGGVTGFATVTVFAGALASITVTPDPVGLAATTSQQFTATGRDASGNVVAITPTWTVVAGGGTINSGSGLFTAGTVPGTYTNTVRATSGGVSGHATVTVVAGALASITVTPNPVSLASTTSQQFAATGRDASGNTVVITPTWSVVAGGGVIDGVGLFTAGTVPGTYTNTVEATSGGVSGSATVNVVAGPLASITITPDPANLVIGAAQQFTAVGRDASGNVVAITPTWSVVEGGGTINSSSGLFTAGTVPGTYTNTVVATSGGISEFATVTVVAGPLATITVSPDPANLGIGATRTFTAVGRDASGNVVSVTPTWSVVAGGGTIDSGSGLFTAGTLPGTYANTVVATSGAVSGSATVNLVAGPLATITVSPDPANLVIGAGQTFTAVGHDASGNVVPITPAWSVTAGGGTIDGSSGVFTAGTLPGTYTNTVRATSGGIDGFATVNVAAGPLAIITVTPNPASVTVGATRQFTAVGRDASGNVVPITPTWSVVADGGTISGSGLFTAGTTPGTFTNTVQATSGSISGRATVTVVAGALASVTVTPSPVTLAVATGQQFTATGRDAFGNVIPITPTWSVVDGGGTISGSGLFTAGTVPGTYTNTVVATSGGVSGSATVTVVAGPLATVTVSPDPANLGIGATQQFTAIGRDAFGNTVAITPTWSTVAGGGTISGSGVFTAGTLPGTYTNTVQATSGGVSGFATVVIVAGPLATIIVSPDPANLTVGGAQQFTAVGRDASGNVVAITPTWSVVAGGGTIDSGSGLFTAGTVPGTFTNTVVATSGTISGSATVTVSAGPLASIMVTPNPVSLTVATGQQFTATGRDAFGNVVAITPTWSVVAGGGTIGGSGLFTAGTVPGTYTNTVRATSGGVSGHATVTVVAGALASITVTPNPADLVTGAIQQFTATGSDAFGNTVVITPTWSVVAGGGSINGSGLFTAGTVPGTYTNTVQATSGAISGFATVTVTVNLGAAASFAVLGGSGASSCTGVSTVSGSVGVSPAGSMSGFPAPCSILAPGDPDVHLNDATAAAAQASVTAANGTLTGMAQTANLTGQDLGGKTLPPGVYDFATSAQLTGTLTLEGPADGIWVFRTGTTLTTAADAKVVLAGSAQAANVYWQVGSSATLGATNDSFLGTVIADQSITLGSGTKLIGRALARTGAVVMVTNIITLP